MKAQEIVFDSLAQRGYTQGWELPTLAYRQLLKSLEELWELGSLFLPSDNEDDEEFRRMLMVLAITARRRFDRMQKDTIVYLPFPDVAAKELADVQVTVFGMAETLRSMGIECDVVNDAILKAKSDVDRGVR